MDPNKISRLLDIAETDDKVKLKVLHNAGIKCLQNYGKESTAAHFTDWQRAEAALSAFVAELGRKYFNEGQEKSLPNIPAVVAHLGARGWKIGKDTVYKHRREGKLRSQPDGSFTFNDVERYAASFLKRKDGSEATKFDGLQQEKLTAEVDKMKAQARHWHVRAETLSGAYVPKELFERELARRASIFRNDLETFARAEASKIIALIGGDPGKIPDVIEFLLCRFGDHLARYAEERVFSVPLPAPEAARDIDMEEDDDAPQR